VDVVVAVVDAVVTAVVAVVTTLVVRAAELVVVKDVAHQAVDKEVVVEAAVEEDKRVYSLVFLIFSY
jgi:hypothetical protein